MKGGNTMLDMIALILLIIGGINWGSIGVFQFDIVAWAFQGQTEIISRIIYTRGPCRSMEHLSAVP